MSAHDLFSWQDEAEAAAQVEKAEEARALAARKARYSPHGEIGARRAKLIAATHEALAAELELERIQRELRLRR